MNNMTEQGVCDLLREKSLLTEKGISLVLNGDFVSLNVTAITAIVNAALASQASKGAGVAQEPIAYMQRRVRVWKEPGEYERETPWEPTPKEWAENNMENMRRGLHLEGEFEFIPLYAAPSPALAQPVAEEECQRCKGSRIPGEVRGVRCTACGGTTIAQPVAYADPQAFKNFDRVRAGEVMPAAASHEWMWARPSNGLVPMYLGAQPVADPMDWPLPCDVTVGNGTHKKGVPLRSLVARMNVLHGMAKSQPVADAEQDPRVTVAMVQDQLKMAMDLIETMRSADKMDYEFGRAAGIEEAAKVCAYSLIDSPTIYEAAAIRKCADAIRTLADKPAEDK